MTWRLLVAYLSGMPAPALPEFFATRRYECPDPPAGEDEIADAIAAGASAREVAALAQIGQRAALSLVAQSHAADDGGGGGLPSLRDPIDDRLCRSFSLRRTNFRPDHT